MVEKSLVFKVCPSGGGRRGGGVGGSKDLHKFVLPMTMTEFVQFPMKTLLPAASPLAKGG
jgi:hypothetical protein